MKCPRSSGPFENKNRRRIFLFLFLSDCICFFSVCLFICLFLLQTFLPFSLLFTRLFFRHFLLRVFLQHLLSVFLAVFFTVFSCLFHTSEGSFCVLSCIYSFRPFGYFVASDRSVFNLLVFLQSMFKHFPFLFPKALRRVLPENPLNTDTSTLTLTH